MAVSRFILASRSPRRVELLRDDGFAFDIDPADINEDDVPAGLTPAETAVYLATEKARAVAARHPALVVVGADTVVAVGPTLFGKADTPEAARAMLTALGGQRQEVITGIALFLPGAAGPVSQSVRSVVEMRPMSPAELDDYIASDQWRGKAGAYGIQDVDPEQDPFVRLIEGEFTNVVGLPMPVVRAMLASAGIHPAQT